MNYTFSGYINKNDVPEWKREIAPIIAAEHEQDVIEYDTKFRAAVSSVLSAADPGTAGIAVHDIMTQNGRTVYKTGFEVNGRVIDYSFDLLLHSISIHES
jgi:hypothetical protein